MMTETADQSMSERSAAPVPKRFLIPGTFDPITRGHLDVIERSCRLCDEIIVAVAQSKDKRGGTTFTLEERVEMVKETCAHLPSVTVVSFCGLLVDFARSLGNISAVVKGLRVISDFEYEFQQAHLNYCMAPELEEIFVMGSAEYGFVSSSAVREIASLGGDVSQFVTPNVAKALREHAF